VKPGEAWTSERLAVACSRDLIRVNVARQMVQAARKLLKEVETIDTSVTSRRLHEMDAQLEERAERLEEDTKL